LILSEKDKTGLFILLFICYTVTSSSQRWPAKSAHIGYVLEYSFAGLPWAEIIIK